MQFFYTFFFVGFVFRFLHLCANSILHLVSISNRKAALVFFGKLKVKHLHIACETIK